MKINLTNLALSNNLITFDCDNIETLNPKDFRCILSKYAIHNNYNIYMLIQRYLGNTILSLLFPLLQKIKFIAPIHYIHLFDSKGEYLGCHEFLLINN
jgi:hypothetical protein